ncbi:MAG: hypothetical protein AMXMBFR7_26750 [Planctomycetota bacterium]
MLIFDGFKTSAGADAFARAVGGTVYQSQDESDQVDPIPCDLIPPIVLVARADSDVAEQRLARRVKRYGGEFAGT